MSVVLVVLAPGQGSQRTGFLAPWLEIPTVARRLDWLSAVAGMDLAEHGATSDADTIRDTAVAQPLLVAAGLVASLEVFPHPADAFDQIGAVAGHSVGELTAAAGAGVISAEQAMVLVRERGGAMAAAARTTATGMVAVLGGQPDDVREALARHGLTAANDNGPGQLVAAGTLQQLEALAADPPPRARLTPLPVAGAFHTEHMAPAVGVLERLAPAVTTHDARTATVSNRDGAVTHDGRDVLRRIVEQVRRPVRWDLCLRTFADLGVTGILEMPPSGTLTAIAKRALDGVETFALRTPDQVDAARDFCERHGEPSPLENHPVWRLLVAPATGTFTATTDLASGSRVPEHTAVGAVATRRDRTPVTAPYGGTVLEWLVSDGDPVSAGQPLLRLHPEAVSP